MNKVLHLFLIIIYFCCTSTSCDDTYYGDGRSMAIWNMSKTDIFVTGQFGYATDSLNYPGKISGDYFESTFIPAKGRNNNACRLEGTKDFNKYFEENKSDKELFYFLYIVSSKVAETKSEKEIRDNQLYMYRYAFAAEYFKYMGCSFNHPTTEYHHYVKVWKNPTLIIKSDQ